jgi:hypothetical protein
MRTRVIRGAAALLALTTPVSVASFGASAPGASAFPTAARIVDRTLACTAGFNNGARSITVDAQTGYRKDGTFQWLAQATVSTPGNPLSKQNRQPTLVGVTAGWPAPPPLSSGALGYENARCGPTTARLPLSTRGLTGGAAGTFGDEVRCNTAKTVLVRVRATFHEPVVAEPNAVGSFISASGRIVVGKIAARTTSGKPLVYADVSESGRARLFTAGGCS